MATSFAPRPAQHVLDHVVAPDAHRIRHDLGRQVTVADVPGEADKVGRRPPPHLDQRFGRRNDLDEAAVLERERVAAAQPTASAGRAGTAGP